MSVEHRPTKPPGRASGFVPPIGPAEIAPTRPTDPIPLGFRRALAIRIERTKLQAEIAALERELAVSECRRQAIVGQYELLLEERTCDCDRAARPTVPRLTSFLRRLR